MLTHTPASNYDFLSVFYAHYAVGFTYNNFV